MKSKPFSGSYRPEDVTFLLKRITLPPLSISEREMRIQSGQAHYSEMIGFETPPLEAYMDLFRESLARNITRLASDLLKLSYLIKENRKQTLTLVSLARSGTPAGVILGRILRRYFDREAIHYSVSIIRDRGLDLNALETIIQSHAPESIVFIDGWTGKGAIARELLGSVEKFNKLRGVNIDPYPAVIADPAGVAGLSAGTDDYLIPFCLLNSTATGLISRTILNQSAIGLGDYHGCVYYGHLSDYDISTSLADEVTEEAGRIASTFDLRKTANVTTEEKIKAAKINQDFIQELKTRFGIIDSNHIKPGISESTRVLLRRTPELLLINDLKNKDVEHALYLAKMRNVPVVEEKTLPYQAAAIIKNLKKCDF
jgi:hypothetical protein